MWHSRGARELGKSWEAATGPSEPQEPEHLTPAPPRAEQCSKARPDTQKWVRYKLRSPLSQSPSFLGKCLFVWPL